MSTWEEHRLTLKAKEEHRLTLKANGQKLYQQRKRGGRGSEGTLGGEASARASVSSSSTLLTSDGSCSFRTCREKERM